MSTEMSGKSHDSSHEDIRAALLEVQASALAITGHLLLATHMRASDSLTRSRISPTIWIEASARPDVTDLGRVHASEGAGRVWSHWLYSFEPPRCIYLCCQYETPVRTHFSVAFSLPKQVPLLEAVIWCRRLSIIPSPPPAEISRYAERWPQDVLDRSETFASDMGLTLDLAAHLHDELVAILGKWYAYYDNKEHTDGIR